ncbi:hypothetical protein EV385_6774 [Krasilnikovia cinnamomea]|uniref:Uncharacterized protein n=1 Tax=Krasilnikovia cinnamomea TaxID=349313 RepID=A0A4Q7Z865_9ACTN|nr:hypothetical protein EV385_6774 [Krasilnikovia cinnamomea]
MNERLDYTRGPRPDPDPQGAVTEPAAAAA